MLFFPSLLLPYRAIVLSTFSFETSTTTYFKIFTVTTDPHINPLIIGLKYCKKLLQPGTRSFRTYVYSLERSANFSLSLYIGDTSQIYGTIPACHL